MHRQVSLGIWSFVGLLVMLLAAAPASHAGFMDAVKKKVSDKVTQKAGEKSDKAIDKASGDTEKSSAPAATESEGTATPGDAAKGASGGTVSSVSTKFDFVPGDSVIFWDDFTQDDLGEFPTRWRLSMGTFEVAEMDGERWLRCMSIDGHILMKVPAGLPEFWTLEFDVVGLDTHSYVQMLALNKHGSAVWETMYPHAASNMSFRCGDIFSTTPLERSVTARHRVMFMGRGNAVKAYMDRERLANVPDITASGQPVEFDFRLVAPSDKMRPMITNVRFASGCRPAKDMLAEGKLVTHGIHFATGSDVVMPESAPVLRQIANYLQANPNVKLKITGHTDNVGTAVSNLDLSKRRAASVAKVLGAEFGVAADRFESDGKGDTQAMASNAKPEGRAMNRRVEFARL